VFVVDVAYSRIVTVDAAAAADEQIQRDAGQSPTLD